ncbi:ATP-binding protein [Bacteroidota bacterium]
MKKKNKPFEAINKDERIYRHIFENMVEVLYRADNKGRITLISPSAVEMFGYESTEEFIGKNIAETFYYNPTDRQVFLDKLSEQNKVVHYPLVLKKKDGSMFRGTTTSYYIFDDECKHIGVEGIIMDTSEQFVAEQVLQQSADILNSTQLGIYIYQLEDLEDDKTLRMISANPASEKLTGVPAMEVIGKTLDENFPGLREKGIPQMYAEVIRSQNPIEIEDIYYGDNRVIASAFSVKAFPLPNMQVGVSFENITDRKNIENEIIAKNKELEETLAKINEIHTQLILSEKMASLGEITAGVAHEIKNPLNFVTGNIEPLKRDISDVLEILDKYQTLIEELHLQEAFSEVESLKSEMEFGFLVDELHKLMEGISEGANRTKEIVKSLGSFSREGDNKFILHDIHEGIDSTLILLGNKIKNIITVHKEYGEIPEIECLPDRLNQVFMNILSNAIQSMDEKGDIFIKTVCDEASVKISFRDNGKGMTEEVQKRIFKPFYTTKALGKGTGLGLSISYSIVEQHNGKISVSSEPLKGTEFIITLPVKQAGSKS